MIEYDVRETRAKILFLESVTYERHQNDPDRHRRRARALYFRDDECPGRRKPHKRPVHRSAAGRRFRPATPDLQPSIKKPLWRKHRWCLELIRRTPNYPKIVIAGPNKVKI